MQLVQIGQPLNLTIQQFIEQMAVRQSDEIDRLKQLAFARQAARRLVRSTKEKPARHQASPRKRVPHSTVA
jgi:hypothetical protein